MAGMDRSTAAAQLDRVVSPTSDPILTTADIGACLDAARIVDADGNAPIDDGYVETIDVDYAIAEAFDLKAVKADSAPQVRKFTAEGATFERTLPNFEALAARYRSRSTVGGGSGLTVIELDPQTPDRLRPRSTGAHGL